MPGEDQKRFEDYLELERYIEELQAGRAAHPPANLTAAQARIYRMAALFRSASPDAAEPRPEFAQQLRERLLFLEDNSDTFTAEATQKRAAIHPPQEVKEPPAPPARPVPTRKPVRFFSRRGLLSGGAVAAASLLVGAGTERIVETANTPHSSPTPTPTPTTYANVPLVQGPTKLYFVTTLDKLGEGAVQFRSDNIIGYVIRNDHDNGETSNEAIIAMSAACTHMGCIIDWSDGDRQFHCPCHGGAFTEYGQPAAGPVQYLNALPRLKVQIIDGNKIYVEVPDPTAAPTTPSAPNKWQ